MGVDKANGIPQLFPCDFGVMDCSYLAADMDNIRVFQIGLSGASVHQFDSDSCVVTADLIHQIVLDYFGPSVAARVELIVYRFGTNDVKSFFPTKKNPSQETVTSSIGQIAHYCLQFGTDLATKFSCHAYWLGCGQGFDVGKLKCELEMELKPVVLSYDRSARFDRALTCLNGQCQNLSPSSFDSQGRMKDAKVSSGAFALYSRPCSYRVVNSGTGHFVSREYPNDCAGILNSINFLFSKFSKSFKVRLIKVPGEPERWTEKFGVSGPGITVYIGAFEMPNPVSGIPCLSVFPLAAPSTEFAKPGPANVKFTSARGGFPFGTPVSVVLPRNSYVEKQAVVLDPCHAVTCIVLFCDRSLGVIPHKAVYTIAHFLPSSFVASEKRLKYLSDLALRTFGPDVFSSESSDNEDYIIDEASESESESKNVSGSADPVAENCPVLPAVVSDDVEVEVVEAEASSSVSDSADPSERMDQAE
jgi:hypothetical protein